MRVKQIVSHYDNDGKLLYQEERISEEREIYNVSIGSNGIPQMMRVGKEEITTIRESKYKYNF